MKSPLDMRRRRFRSRLSAICRTQKIRRYLRTRRNYRWERLRLNRSHRTASQRACARRRRGRIACSAERRDTKAIAWRRCLCVRSGGGGRCGTRRHRGHTQRRRTSSCLQGRSVAGRGKRRTMLSSH